MLLLADDDIGFTLTFNFSEGARSVPCPFSGRHKFSYRTDNGICDLPLSHMKPCAGTGKFHFKYAKCNQMDTVMLKGKNGKGKEVCILLSIQLLKISLQICQVKPNKYCST